MEKRKSGNKCCYLNCYKTKRICEKLKLFRFPTDPDLCNKWLNNCGKYNINTKDTY